MTNDTTTLNGALSELGETLASNITAKGVSASASDGLTTLANKVLQITGGGGSTTLFEDACSTDNTSQYTECYDYWELTNNPQFTITFNTDHYTISHSTGDFMGVCLPNLTTSVDNYVFTADVLAVGTNTDYGGGIGMVKKVNNGTGQGMVQPNSATSNHKHTYLTNTANSGSVVSQVVTTGYVVDEYHTHRLTKQGTSRRDRLMLQN